MTALRVLGIVLGVLAALWFLPVRLRLRYDQSGGRVILNLGPFAKKLYPPKPKKKKKPKKPTKTAEPKPETDEEKPEEKAKRQGIGGKLPLFRQLLGLGIEALERLLRHLTVTDLNLRLAVATQGKDPAAAALKYGGGWSAVGALVPFLEQHFRIKSRKIDVIMDQQAAEDRIFASGTLHIFLGELLFLCVHYGIRGLKIYLRTKKKGGNRNGTSDQ